MNNISLVTAHVLRECHPIMQIIEKREKRRDMVDFLLLQDNLYFKKIKIL
jgi:hypothetical protein